MMLFNIFIIALLGCISECRLAKSPLLHWYAPFYSGGGYSSEALSFVKIIAAQNISVRITQHGDSFNKKYVEHMEPSDTKLLRHMDTFVATSGEVSICHSEPGAWHAPYPRYHTYRCPAQDAAYTIGRTMFETDRIPNGWADRLNTMDEIWVPTEFAATIFKEYGVAANKVIVVEEPVDTNFYRPMRDKSADTLRTVVDTFAPPQTVPPEASDTACVFLFVGKWEYRKGVQLLLRAFFDAFATDNEQIEDVLLVVVTSAYHSTSDFHSEIRRYLREEGILSPPRGQSHAKGNGERGEGAIASLLARIVLLWDVPQAAMPALYNAADVLVRPSPRDYLSAYPVCVCVYLFILRCVFVYLLSLQVIPSRGEGWGRPHVEAMSCGIPVIATNWSGVTAYLTADNGYPLAVEGLVPAR